MAKKTKKTKSRGRRSLLTKERQDKIVQGLESGNTYKTSAALAGISESGFWKWMERGEAELARVDEDGRRSVKEKERPYVEFVEAIRKARAQAECFHVSRVQLAASGIPDKTEVSTVEHPDGRVEKVTVITKGQAPSWQASAWWLERTNPKEFGRKLQHANADGDGDAVISLTISQVNKAVREGKERAKKSRDKARSRKARKNPLDS